MSGITHRKSQKVMNYVQCISTNLGILPEGGFRYMPEECDWEDYIDIPGGTLTSTANVSCTEHSWVVSLFFLTQASGCRLFVRYLPQTSKMLNLVAGPTVCR